MTVSSYSMFQRPADFFATDKPTPLSNADALIENYSVIELNLTFYRKIIKDTNHVLIYYMDEPQRQKHRQHLEQAFYLLYIQQHLTYSKAREKEMQDCYAFVKKCESEWTIDEPSFSKTVQESLFFAEVTAKFDESMHYLRTVLAQLAKYDVEDWAKLLATKLSDFLNQLNDIRLFWVWGGGVLDVVMRACPEGTFGEGLKALAGISKISNHLSYAIYAMHFLLSLGFFLCSLFPTTDEEKKISLEKRAQMLWAEAKYIFINDVLWGGANGLGAFLWFSFEKDIFNNPLNPKQGELVYSQADVMGVITFALLIVDLTVCLIRLNEQEKLYDEAIAAQEALVKEDPNDREMQSYLEQLRADKLHDCSTTLLATVTTGLYTAAYTIMCAAFIPHMYILDSTKLIVGLAGNILSFLITVLSGQAQGYIIQEKFEKYIKLNHVKSDFLVEGATLAALESKKVEYYYFQWQQLQNENTFLQAKGSHEKGGAILASLQKSLLVLAFFPAFHFMLFWPAVGLIAGALAVCIIAEIVKWSLKPEESSGLDMTRFDEFKGLLGKEDDELPMELLGSDDDFSTQPTK